VLHVDGQKDRWRDRLDKVNSCFSQFCECAQKLNLLKDNYFIGFQETFTQMIVFLWRRGEGSYTVK
jgi:hypothetical protein